MYCDKENRKKGKSKVILIFLNTAENHMDLYVIFAFSICDEYVQIFSSSLHKILTICITIKKYAWIQCCFFSL